MKLCSKSCKYCEEANRGGFLKSRGGSEGIAGGGVGAGVLKAWICKEHKDDGPGLLSDANCCAEVIPVCSTCWEAGNRTRL